MPDAKFLDLDAVNTPIGRLKFQGVLHDVMPMSIGNLINLAVLSEGREAIGEERVRDHLEQALDILGELIPTVDRATFRQLSMAQLSKLMDWAQSLGEKAVEKNS